ncbi:MAG TPA: hypothetical protein VFW51_06115, partial [Actinomycetota bacterium]|nr:hypothetical protein [Actinomycetota bacterium]
RVTPRLPALAPTYRVELIDARVYRMTRDPGPAAWPDTVLIHLFVDSADEEIALERGDVDIAIFWPGELSTRMREHARWRGSPSGVLDGRILAFVGGLDVSDAVPDTASARAFRDDLFRGDLTTDGLPWGGPRSDLQRRYWQFLSQNLELDVPGAPQIRQWIAQQKRIMFTGAKLPRARLTIIEDAPDRRDSGTHPLFRLRCPVVCAAALRPFVDAIGADVFANLARCAEVPR